jgi:phosphonopyruvate decarboxylase
MIEPNYLYKEFIKFGTDFFTGVPDSLLKNFCTYITNHTDKNHHIIAVNEGAAIGLAAGYHFATGKAPLVYMQNSGIGNATNPLLSLTDSDVYQIPMVLVIGWRGEPGVYDEPQHITQGKLTTALLETMNIPYVIMSQTHEELQDQLILCYKALAKTGAPYAFIVQKDTFAPCALQKNEVFDAFMTREEAIELILNIVSPDKLFISTTGMASRELYELREKRGTSHKRDFLMVGSMGYASSIALGIALQKPKLSVICLDGDGAALMHLGTLAAIGVQKPHNLYHIVLNNGAHDSVGGQPTLAPYVDLPAIARACGYRYVYSVKSPDELRTALTENEGLTFIEIRVKKGARKNLGRPKLTPIENKIALMEYIQGKNA